MGKGRLRVGAAIGVHDYERAESLLAKDVDVLVVDSAHGHSANVIETVKNLKKRWDIDVVAGNVATAEGCSRPDRRRSRRRQGRHRAGLDLHDADHFGRRRAADYRDLSKLRRWPPRHDVPVIADGGIRYSGDVTKAMAAGAHVVMIGGLFAGLAESPGEQILYQGRTFKVYRGMGSLGAMVQGSSERYRQRGAERRPGKLVPEGVEGRVPFKGPLSSFVYQLVGGLRAGMGYCGTQTHRGVAQGHAIHPNLRGRSTGESSS